MINIIGKIKRKLTGWKKRTLSRTSKMTLIKTNLASIPSYIITVAHMPKYRSTQNDNNARDFFRQNRT